VKFEAKLRARRVWRSGDGPISAYSEAVVISESEQHALADAVEALRLISVREGEALCHPGRVAERALARLDELSGGDQ
jgi:hypothetical protein